MRRPNFFIVGAPKCGTTALSEYLRGHPNVFLTDPKEPHYFSSDFSGHRYARDEQDYLALFRYAAPEQQRLGEASVGYLYSRTALPAIREFSPDARVIAMVRNPVGMAISLHRQLLYARYEDVSDFETAWRLQAERRAGRRIPATCRAPEFLQYADVCRLGQQVARLYTLFPREQIKVILFDDFIADTRRVYRETLEFLGLPDDHRATFPPINEAKKMRSTALSRLVVRGKPLVVSTASLLRKTVGLNLFPMLRYLERLNQVPAVKQPIQRSLCEEMLAVFREDIDLLAATLDRDLAVWLTVCKSFPESKMPSGSDERAQEVV
jgi:hypothetical protein